MNIQLVQPTPAFTITCKVCGRKVLTTSEPTYADSEGVPWVDYFCQDHVPTAEQEADNV